jgi:hypothetical protein
MGAKTPSLDTIFCTAVEIGSAEERAIYLERACGADHDLRGRVENLVAAHFRAGSFLESPAVPCQRDTEAARANGPAATIDQPIASWTLGNAFSPNGRHVAVGLANGTVGILRLSLVK